MLTAVRITVIGLRPDDCPTLMLSIRLAQHCNVGSRKSLGCEVFASSLTRAVTANRNVEHCPIPVESAWSRRPAGDSRRPNVEKAHVRTVDSGMVGQWPRAPTAPLRFEKLILLTLHLYLPPRSDHRIHRIKVFTRRLRGHRRRRYAIGWFTDAYRRP